MDFLLFGDNEFGKMNSGKLHLRKPHSRKTRSAPCTPIAHSGYESYYTVTGPADSLKFFQPNQTTFSLIYSFLQSSRRILSEQQIFMLTLAMHVSKGIITKLN